MTKKKIIHLHGAYNLGGVTLFCEKISENNVKVAWSICSPKDNYNRRTGREHAAKLINSRYLIISPADFSFRDISIELMNQLYQKHLDKLNGEPTLLGNTLGKMIISIYTSIHDDMNEEVDVQMMELIDAYANGTRKSVLGKHKLKMNTTDKDYT